MTIKASTLFILAVLAISSSDGQNYSWIPDSIKFETFDTEEQMFHWSNTRYIDHLDGCCKPLRDSVFNGQGINEANPYFNERSSFFYDDLCQIQDFVLFVSSAPGEEWTPGDSLHTDYDGTNQVQTRTFSYVDELWQPSYETSYYYEDGELSEYTLYSYSTVNQEWNPVQLVEYDWLDGDDYVRIFYFGNAQGGWNLNGKSEYFLENGLLASVVGYTPDGDDGWELATQSGFTYTAMGNFLHREYFSTDSEGSEWLLDWEATYEYEIIDGEEFLTLEQYWVPNTEGVMTVAHQTEYTNTVSSMNWTREAEYSYFEFFSEERVVSSRTTDFYSKCEASVSVADIALENACFELRGDQLISNCAPSQRYTLNVYDLNGKMLQTTYFQGVANLPAQTSTPAVILSISDKSGPIWSQTVVRPLR